MKRLFIWLLWVVVIVGSCIALDQLLLRASFPWPALVAAQTFYQDFRGRFIQVANKKDLHLEMGKENWRPTLPTIPPAVTEKIKPLLQPEPEPGGYVYSDKAGGLHLVNRLDEVPKEYRSTAKQLQK